MLKKDIKKREKEERSLGIRYVLSILILLIIVAILVFSQIAEDKEKSEIQNKIKVASSKDIVETKNQKTANNFEIFDFKKSNNFVALKVSWLSNIYWSQNVNVVLKEKMSSISVAEFQAEYRLLSEKTAEISFLLNPVISPLFRGLNKEKILEKYNFEIRPVESKPPCINT